MPVTEPDVADVPELEPLLPVVVFAEKGLAEPPHPTMELTVIAATLKFIKTLGPNCTFTLEPIFPTN